MANSKRRSLTEPLRHVVRASRERRRRVGFYRQFVQPEGLCFDIGANCGQRVELFLAIPARVVAVEPQSACRAFLEARFGGDPRFTLEPVAVGAVAGEAELMAADDREASVLATLSPEWVDRVQESGRFARFAWTRSERVGVTTLESLIERYGVPQFCKIDVEGYEPEVLAGLNTPIGSLSFEFTPERSEATDECVMRLVDLGPYEFNYSLNESLALTSELWLSAKQLTDRLAQFEGDHVTFGDVYARHVEP